MSTFAMPTFAMPTFAMTAPATDHRPPDPVLGVLFRPVADGPFTAGRRLSAAAAAAAVLAGVAVLDERLSPAVRLGPLYLLPVVLAAWFGGRWPGYLTAVAAAVVWFVLPRYPPLRADGTMGLIVGSLAPRLVIYPAMVELITLLQEAERRLRRAVEERTAELRREIVDRCRAEASLRVLAAQLSAAEDAERRRIALDIHDALSQTLGVIKLNLETAVAHTAIDARPYDRMNDTVGMVDDLIRQTRDLTFDLHPSMLDHFGLVPTLREFAGQFGRRTVTEVTVNEVGDRAPVPVALASYLFRAAKEVVSNAVRHGTAREVIVTVRWPDRAAQPGPPAAGGTGGGSGSGGSGGGGGRGQMRVVIDDDGSGFDSAAALTPRAGRGLGLPGIGERLAGMGGRLRLESQPGRGSRVILEVPLAEPFPEATGPADRA